MEFLPTVGTTVNSEGKIVVEIRCVSEASPEAVVSWSKGSEALTNVTAHQISSDTTRLKISHYNVSNFLLQNYSCSCNNPLGSQRREIQLRGILLLLLDTYSCTAVADYIKVLVKQVYSFRVTSTILHFRGKYCSSYLTTFKVSIINLSKREVVLSEVYQKLVP